MPVRHRELRGEEWEYEGGFPHIVAGFLAQQAASAVANRLAKSNNPYLKGAGLTLGVASIAIGAVSGASAISFAVSGADSILRAAVAADAVCEYTVAPVKGSIDLAKSLA